MKVSGSFYVFSEGANWMCNEKDSRLVRLMTYLLVFSDFDSGRVSVTAGLVNAASQDLGLEESEVRECIDILSETALIPMYGIYRDGDRAPRHVIAENEYYVHANYFWHGSYDGRKRFMRWFVDDVSCKRNNELRRLGKKETQWLVEPLDKAFKEKLDEEYRKKKELEEKKRISAEKRAAKKAAKLAEQAV